MGEGSRALPTNIINKLLHHIHLELYQFCDIVPNDYWNYHSQRKSMISVKLLVTLFLEKRRRHLRSNFQFTALIISFPLRWLKIAFHFKTKGERKTGQVRTQTEIHLLFPFIFLGAE